MNFFKRLFKLGQSEVHSALDKLEDPIKMTEQGIRDMKSQLDAALKGLAEVKALAIRSRTEFENSTEKSKDYEKKAMLLIQRAEKGDMDATEADRLATEALVKKKESDEFAQNAKKDMESFESQVSRLDSQIKRLRQSISKYENELRTLKSRVKVSNATKMINKQMAGIDSTSTVSLLERMKDKVAQDEALAESYGEIANESRSVDEEIDKALAGSKQTEASDDLAALKARLAKKSAS